MSSDLLVDALPYIDTGYDEPGVKQAVKYERFLKLFKKNKKKQRSILKAFALIEEECRRYKPNKNYLDFLGPMNLTAFQSDILKSEFNRMEQRQPMEMLSMKR